MTLQMWLETRLNNIKEFFPLHVEYINIHWNKIQVSERLLFIAKWVFFSAA